MNKSLNSEERQLRLKRLRFRSWHRGCKETDLILGRFSDARLPKLCDADLAALEALLEEDDADIWDWLTGRVPPPEAYAALIELLLLHAGESA